MKQISKIKLFSAAFLVALSLFSVSCVDNTVSPQVEAIRAQQVEWMKAKTATELAVAAVQTAEVDFKKAATANQISQTATAAALAAETLKQTIALNALAFTSQVEKDRAVAALNAQNEKTAQMAYDRAKADNDQQYALYLTKLATDKLTLATATAALAKATEDAKNTNATTYYANYKALVDDVVALSITKASKAKLIADNTTAITFATTTSANATAALTNQKTAAQNTLVAQNASLASLIATATDPISIQTKIDNLKKINATYQVSIDSVNLVLQNKTNDIASKNAVYIAATTTISNYVTLKGALSGYQTDSIAKESAIVSATLSISTQTTLYASQSADAAAKLAYYSNAKTISDAKQATYDALKGVSDAANYTLQNANNALSIATANLASDPVSAPFIIAKASAQTAQSNAQTAYNTANANTIAANSTLTIALNITNPAKTAYDNAKTSASNTQTSITTAQASLVTNQQALGNSKITIQICRDKITALSADYQKAVTTQTTLNSAYQAALIDKQKTQDILDLKTTLQTANISVINTLTSAKTTATGFETAIETLQANIATTKTTIASLDKQLALVDSADPVSGKAALTNANAILTQENAALDNKIVDENKLAAYWKGMLDKIFTV